MSSNIFKKLFKGGGAQDKQQGHQGSVFAGGRDAFNLLAKIKSQRLEGISQCRNYGIYLNDRSK